MINLDLIIATYNRPELLLLTIASIAGANIPDDLQLRIIIADNNSSPEKQELNKAVLQKYSMLNLVYLFETRQGKSWALNTAIEQSHADYIAFIDDDEKLDVNWFQVAARHLREARIDFFSGPSKPDWAAKAPCWLPLYVGKYKAILGWIEQNDRVLSFDDFDGVLSGGNCVIRRSALMEAGGFSTMIGRSGYNLMCGEDDELHRKLRARGKLGMYDPALIIYHYIPAQRMTRRYHLRWAFWSGASNGVRLNWLPSEPVPKLLGLPRYRFSLGFYGLIRFLYSPLSRAEMARAHGFSGLLDAAYLIGTLYGKHCIRPVKELSETQPLN